MMKRLLCVLLLFVPTAVFAQNLANPICGLTNDSTNHPPTGSAVTTVNGATSYSWHDFVLNVPNVGGTWVDNTYGCPNKILTNAVTLNAGQTQNYAISTAMDFGDCYVLALDANAGLSSQYILASPTADCSGGFGAWGATVLSSAQMASRSNHSEFIWDTATKGKLWNVNRNILFSCTITGMGTSSCANAHTFSEYAGSGCIFMDYAAMSGNGNIDIVCQNSAGGTMDLFTYNTLTNTKNNVYTTTCTGTVPGNNQPGCIHKLAGPTIDNGILIQFTGSSCTAESGNHLWAPPWTLPTPQIECRTDHVDVMGDLSSNSVGLYEDFQDNPNYCTAGFRPAKTFLPLSGNPVGMICAPVAFGWDISTRDWPNRPWGLYSVQGSQGGIGVSEDCNNNGSYADPTSGNWNTFANELVLTRVDAANNFTKIWRLGLTHERGKCGGNTFYSDPRAALSTDGKYVVYATNARFGGTGTGPAVLTDIVVMGPLFSSSGPAPAIVIFTKGNFILNGEVVLK